MSARKILSALLLGGILFSIFVLTIGLYPHRFTFEWDEEVQLHDGQVILVHVTSSYERQHHEFGRYQSAIIRDVEISFDSGGGKKITQLFKGGRPLLLDQKDGQWYLVLAIGPYRNSQLLPGQDFGPDQTGRGQHVAILKGDKFAPASICLMPDEFRRPNFLVRYAGASELAKFDGERVTLTDKAEYLQKYPLLPGTVIIERPVGQYACKSAKE